MTTAGNAKHTGSATRAPSVLLWLAVRRATTNRMPKKSIPGFFGPQGEKRAQ